jgi:hypothetical protein
LLGDGGGEGIRHFFNIELETRGWKLAEVVELLSNLVVADEKKKKKKFGAARLPSARNGMARS